MSLFLENKIALVTGASRGLGAAILACLQAHGSHGAAVDREFAMGTDILPKGFIPIEADVRDEASMKAAIDQTVAHFGRVDIVVANAGVVPPGSET